MMARHAWLYIFFAAGFLCYQKAGGQSVAGNAKPSADQQSINAWLDLAFEFEGENLDSSGYYYQKAGALADRINDYDGRMRYAFGYTIVLNAKGEFSQSEKILRNALAVARKNDDALNTAKALVNVGNVFNHRGIFDSAYVYYVDAIPYLKKAGATHFLDILYSNIGVLLQNTGRNEEALGYYDKGLAVATELNDSIRMATVLSNRGIVLNNLDRYEDAIATFKQAIAFGKDHLSVLGSAYSNLANAYQLTNRNIPALENYQKALVFFEKLGDDDGRGQALMGHAIVYFNMKEYVQAEQFAERAISYLQEHPTSRLALYKLLAEVKYNLNKFTESRDYFSKHIALQKEMQNLQIQESISDAEKKFQVAQKEEELAVKELLLTKSALENRKKDFYLVMMIVISVALVLISMLFLRNMRQRSKLFKIERDNLAKEKEVSVLKANIDGAKAERTRIAKELHDDLGTGLTSIRFLAERLSTPEQQQQIDNATRIKQSARTLTEQMNEIVWSMNTESDSLAELLIYIRTKIAAFLEENDIDFAFDMPAEIPDKTLSGLFRRQVYLTIKEAVNNAVKHAATSRIDIQIRVEPDLIITVRDHGKGFSEDEQWGAGHGIRNMKDRVQSLSGQIEISFENGTRVRITIPYSMS